MGKLELQINLNKFKWRPYQEPIFDAIEKRKIKKILLNWSRRSGKDCTAFNIMLRAALTKVGVYFYCLPTYNQGRKVIWDGILSNGQKFLDFVPFDAITNKNSSEMKLTLINGSIIQVVGSDTAAQSLVGTNPQGCVFSEWALSDPTAYQFIKPALIYNDGWAIFVSTPRGRNHFFELYEIARNSPDWFVSTKTVNDTGHISLADIEKERETLSEDMIQQEFFCSFSAGVEGSYYGRYIEKMRLDNRICQVPCESSLRVNTVWDLGVNDPTVIIFYQIAGTTIRIIDCYQNTDKGLDHYAKILDQKGYIYNKHFAPHDIAVRELGTGLSRLETAKRLGIKFTVLDNIPIEDGIEQVRLTISRWWIDEQKCQPLIKALEAYRKEWDSKKQVYKPNPLHDWSSHFADCARYLALSLPKTKDSISAEELDKRYQETVYGRNNMLPPIFRDDLPKY